MGKEKVHYQSPGSDRIDIEMEKFLTWFENENETDLVLKAAKGIQPPINHRHNSDDLCTSSGFQR
jgi:hypothetical protein